MSTPNEATSAKPGMGFKIATIILAVTTLGFAVWGFVTYQSLNTANKATSSANATIAEEEAAIAASNQEIKQLQSNYATEKVDFDSEHAQLVKQRSVYDAAQKKASANAANIEAQLAASQAQSVLAQKCAAILASGLVQIYDDSPTGVTQQEVAVAMAKASVPCKGVVNLNPLVQ